MDKRKKNRELLNEIDEIIRHKIRCYHNGIIDNPFDDLICEEDMTLRSIDELKNFIEDSVKNLSVLKVKTLDHVIRILYFVRCSDIHTKAYIKHKLQSMVEDHVMIGVSVELFDLTLYKRT